MANKNHAKAIIMRALRTLSDDEQRETVAVLMAHAHRFGAGGNEGPDGKLEQVTRYASKVAQAQNAERGRQAGSPRALPGSTCMTVVRDLCAKVAQGIDPLEAHNAQRSEARMGGVEESASAAIDASGLFG